MFQGALVCVDGFYPVKFSTENAQMQDMGNKEANPLTESYEFSGTAVAGEDFPEGTYDVYAVGDDFGIFQFSLDLIRVDYTVPFSFSTLMEKNPTGEYPGYCSVYKMWYCQKEQFWNLKHFSFSWCQVQKSLLQTISLFMTIHINLEYNRSEHE